MIRNIYHITRNDWFSAYNSRKCLHSYDFAKTRSTTRGYENGRRRRRRFFVQCSDYENGITIDQIKNALLTDEIHVKMARDVEFHSAYEYRRYDARCMSCDSILPENAYYVSQAYYCSSCIKTKVLAPFCEERLKLLYLIETFPIDLILYIMKCLVFLSFDHNQIHAGFKKCLVSSFGAFLSETTEEKNCLLELKNDYYSSYSQILDH